MQPEKPSNPPSQPESQSGLATRSSMIHDLKALSDERWSEFVAVYSKWLRYYIRQERVPGPAVEEVLQEVLKSLHGGIGKFERNPKLGKFRGWMRQVIEWRAADYRKKRSKIKAQFNAACSIAEENALAESMLDRSTDEESQSDDEDLKILRETVSAAMSIVRKKVKPKTWEMFERRELNKENSADIAADLGVTLDHIRVSVKRVKTRLKDILRDDFDPKS